MSESFGFDYLNEAMFMFGWLKMKKGAELFSTQSHYVRLFGLYFIISWFVLILIGFYRILVYILLFSSLRRNISSINWQSIFSVVDVSFFLSTSIWFANLAQTIWLYSNTNIIILVCVNMKIERHIQHLLTNILWTTTSESNLEKIITTE